MFNRSYRDGIEKAHAAVERMNHPKRQRPHQTVTRAIVVTTVVIALIEWLLFELTRLPYRPPEDMKTLLGRERFVVHLLMVGIALGWVVGLICWSCWIRFTIREYTFFVLLMGGLATVFMILIIHPFWPVTPWELMGR